jgi:hypothetical protein
MDKSDSVRTVYRRIFFAQIAILLAFVAIVAVLSIYTEEAGSFPFSFLLGGLGGSISLFRRLPNEHQENLLQISESWISTLVPILYGSIMASVAYLLFMSGILTGEQGHGLFTSNLFPNFTRPEIPQGKLLTVPMILQIRPASVADVGKLLVWSFLAGYSERFVTGILSTLEQKGPADKT